MRAIPQKHRKLFSVDPRFKKCWVCGSLAVEINHTFIYSGRQVNELWAYSALCKEHHTGKEGFHNNREMRERIELECLEKVDTLALLEDYPRYDWAQRKKYLSTKYGS